MPSPKAAAEEWSYGIKASGSASFMMPNTKEQKQTLEKDHRKAGWWNPWLGGALYMEYPLNDYIGLGVELLYSRFTESVEHKKNILGTTIKAITTIDTIGLPLLLTLHWTTFIRPDFKEDYFLGRLFWGMHPFYCFRHKYTLKYESTGAEQSTDISGNNKHKFKCGFIVGNSLECPNGLLVELKGMFPYNLLNVEDKKERLFIGSFHLSVGYNFAKLLD